MKKINYRKVLIAIIWILVIVGLSASLGFVSKKETGIVANRLTVEIRNNDENPFLSERDVIDFFRERKDPILKTDYANIDIPGLEKALNAHPAIENAEVSADISGELRVAITQRTPVIRIINKSGESYYIDSQNTLMPLNENYSARVIVVTGELYEPYARRYQFTVDQIRKNKLFSEVSLLDDVVDVATYINKDTVLAKLIHQMNVNKDHEIELVPVIGNHKIIFGDAGDIGTKFNKLKLFYTEGLNKSDGWTRYSTINLKYKNLVVCTKK